MQGDWVVKYFLQKWCQLRPPTSWTRLMTWESCQGEPHIRPQSMCKHGITTELQERKQNGQELTTSILSSLFTYWIIFKCNIEANLTLVIKNVTGQPLLLMIILQTFAKVLPFLLARLSWKRTSINYDSARAGWVVSWCLWTMKSGGEPGRKRRRNVPWDEEHRTWHLISSTIVKKVTEAQSLHPLWKPFIGVNMWLVQLKRRNDQTRSRFPSLSLIIKYKCIVFTNFSPTHEMTWKLFYAII